MVTMTSEYDDNDGKTTAAAITDLNIVDNIHRLTTTSTTTTTKANNAVIDVSSYQYEDDDYDD